MNTYSQHPKIHRVCIHCGQPRDEHGAGLLCKGTTPAPHPAAAQIRAILSAMESGKPIMFLFRDDEEQLYADDPNEALPHLVTGGDPKAVMVVEV